MVTIAAFQVNENAEGFQQKKLPLLIRSVASLSRSFPFISPKLTVDSLMKAASRRAKLAPNFSPHVMEGLEVTCRAIREEANLNWFGKMNAEFLIVSGLAEYLLVNEAFRKNPALENQKLNAPIFVTGLPRSGTTFLHRLLASAAGTTSIPLYRHISPTEGYWIPARWEAEMMYYPFKQVSKAYGLDAIHFVRPKLADECNFGMRLGMHSMIYWSMAPTYSYLTWLLAQDLTESYQIYRRVLQLHQMREPNKRLILKCPHHLAFLPALSKVFPEGVIVQTHREPAQTVASECKLYLSLHAIVGADFDWAKTTQHTYFKASTFAQRAVDFMNSNSPNQIVNIDYKRLISDPVELAQEVYKQVGIEVNANQEAKLRAYFSQNRQNKHGKNRYTLAQFGLTAEDINEEFKGYRERFLSV